jgi:hypothetical protein
MQFDCQVEVKERLNAAVQVGQSHQRVFWHHQADLQSRVCFCRWQDQHLVLPQGALAVELEMQA